MMMKNWAAAFAAVPIVLGMSLTAPSAHAPAANLPDARLTAVVKAATPSVTTKVVKGTQKTKRYAPQSFKYTLKVPTLNGVDAKVKKAFDQKIDQLISAELKYYAKGAATKKEFLKWAGYFEGVSTSDSLKACKGNFKDLKGKFTTSMYKGRYASVVMTFSGLNAACGQLGGLWVGYQTDRSITIDTKTGKFMELTDFTSNTEGKVNAAIKGWYSKISHEHFKQSPKLTRYMKSCDRPGNVITVDSKQKACSFSPKGYKYDLVAWQVHDNGLQLTFPAGDGLRYALISWAKIPQS